MIIQRLKEASEFVAGDNTRLRELLHPEKSPVDLRYSLAHASLDAGTASVPHMLKNSEVYYILSGEGLMTIGSEIRHLTSGDTVYIPPGAIQHIQNVGECRLDFLCIVDPAWRAEDEVIYPEPNQQPH